MWLAQDWATDASELLLLRAGSPALARAELIRLYMPPELARAEPAEARPPTRVASTARTRPMTAERAKRGRMELPPERGSVAMRSHSAGTSPFGIGRTGESLCRTACRHRKSTSLHSV